MNIDPRYVVARRVLLDALTALDRHADAIVVAGAQAIYLHTGDADLAIAPFTTDADLTLDPRLLGLEPLLERAMESGGFSLSRTEGHVQPGIWIREVIIDGTPSLVPVDLIVPSAVAHASGRRGARLGNHGNRAARKTQGLEAALVDYGPMTIAAFEADDQRIVTAKVAGPAALLVAKAHKLHDRLQSGHASRLDDKDAADVLRLMQAIPPATIANTMRRLLDHEMAGAVTDQALDHLAALFGSRRRPGIEMAARASRLAMPRPRVEAISVAYVDAVQRVARDPS